MVAGWLAGWLASLLAGLLRVSADVTALPLRSHYVPMDSAWFLGTGMVPPETLP